MLNLLCVGDQPIPGYKLLDDLGGSVFYRLWRVSDPNGDIRMWKTIDLVVGNAAIETRNLKLLAKLRHPQLNTLTNFWQLHEGKTLVIETEVPFKSLRERYQECQRQGLPGVPLPELLPYMEQVALGLDFLNAPRHEFNGEQVAIYHRDLRPDVLLLFKEGNRLVCKVSDFGLAKPVSDEVAQNSVGLQHYDYDPPEFYEGHSAPTSDQYSFAINYYELRTGSLPFAGSMLEQLSARLNDNPKLDLIPDAERSVLRKALAKDPSKRFATSSEFFQQLKAVARADGPTTPVAAGTGSSAGAGMGWPPANEPARPSSGYASSGAESYRSSEPAGYGSRPSAENAPADLPGVVYRPPPSQKRSMEPADPGSGDYRPGPSFSGGPMGGGAEMGRSPGYEQGRAPASPDRLREMRQELRGGTMPTPEEEEELPPEGGIPIIYVILILAGIVGAIAAFWFFVLR